MKTISPNDIQKKLIALTSQLLAESGEYYKREIKCDDSLNRNLGIDSLGRAELFQRIEKAFIVRLPDRLLREADTLADIADYLQTADVQVEKSTQHEVMSSHGDRPEVDGASAKTL